MVIFTLSYAQVLLGTTLTLLTIALYRRYLSSISHVPGPFWASITRLWHVYHIFQGDHNTALLELHEKHGYFVRLAPNEVSVSHPDGPVILLQGLLRKGNWYQVFAMPDWRFMTPQSTLDPKEKIRRSKHFISGYTIANLLRFEKYLDTNIEYLLNWMDRYSETRKPMHLDKFFTYTAFDNAGEAVFSKSFGYIEKGEDLLGSIKNSRSLNRYLAIAGYYPWFHRLFVANPLITWLGFLPMGHLFTVAKAALEKRKANPDSRFDIVGHWLREQQAHPDDLTDREVEAQATVSVAAGSDTVSCALQACIYFTMQHPKSWERARKEIKAAQAGGSCQSLVISYKDALSLPFVKACIYEALRMFGPGPFGFPRIAPKSGIKIGDAYFEEGTVLSINPQIMQQSNACWNNTSKEWDPDRWLTESIETKYKHWLVFGLGYNRCPGEHLALLQIFKIVATIIRDYDIEQADPLREWEYKAYFTVVPHSWPVKVYRVSAS